MRLSTCLLSAATLSILAATTFASVAKADSLQLTLNTSVLLNASSPNDNYWGEYVNIPGRESFNHIYTPAVHGQQLVLIPSLSLSVPDGSVITSTYVETIVALQTFIGTGTVVAVPGGQFTDTEIPNLPSIAPTFSGPGQSDFVNVDFTSGITATTSGDQVYFDPQYLELEYGGLIYQNVGTAGYNYAGYLSGSGQVEIPYTVQLDVTYTPAPEPSTIALFGTGLVGLAGIARRKFLA